MPLFPATSITSPTANWFSSSMKKPAMMSFTRLWAPNDTASPRMPKPARIGPMSMKTLMVSRMASATAAIRPMPRSSCERVRPRFSREVVTRSFPSSTAASMRRAIRLTTCTMSQAITQIATTRRPSRVRAAASTSKKSAMVRIHWGMASSTQAPWYAGRLGRLT